MKGVSVNDGPEVAYSYDKDGLVTKAGALDLSRDPTRGLLTGTTLSNVTDKRTFNAFGEMQSYEALSGTTRLYETTYKLDSLGRIVEKTETIEGSSTTYSYAYDEEGSLRRSSRMAASSLPTPTTRTATALAAPLPTASLRAATTPRIASSPTETNEYAYTPDGQLKTKTDSGSRGKLPPTLTTLWATCSPRRLPDGKKVEYVVDAAIEGWARRWTDSWCRASSTRVSSLPWPSSTGQATSSPASCTLPSTNVPDYMEKGGKTYRIITDQVGSVRLVVDAATGEVAQRIDYDEFGNVLNDTNPGFQPFGFAGGLYDRTPSWCASGQGTTTRRPAGGPPRTRVGFAGGHANLYAYVGRSRQQN